MIFDVIFGDFLVGTGDWGTPAILRQNPNKLSFEKKSWDWQTPPQLGQNPKFFQKFDLKAPLRKKTETEEGEASYIK